MAGLNRDREAGHAPTVELLLAAGAQVMSYTAMQKFVANRNSCGLAIRNGHANKIPCTRVCRKYCSHVPSLSQ
jgi:hypothetical protein